MTQLVLTEEQTRLAASARQPLQVQDANGNTLGTFTPLWTDQEIEEAKAGLASDQTRRTTAQVLEHLRSLRIT